MMKHLSCNDLRLNVRSLSARTEQMVSLGSRWPVVQSKK